VSARSRERYRKRRELFEARLRLLDTEQANASGIKAFRRGFKAETIGEGQIVAAYLHGSKYHKARIEEFAPGQRKFSTG
jgi:hypothetical protein